MDQDFFQRPDVIIVSVKTNIESRPGVGVF